MPTSGWTINFDYRGGGGLPSPTNWIGSWLQWERLMREREERAESLNGYGILVQTGATMTPYDPSAGDTRGIMHYLREGWKGSRAEMKPRWPPGYIAERILGDQPYAPHVDWVTRWMMNGRGDSLPRDTYYELWKDMAEWVRDNLFGGPSPTEQWATYKQTGKGMFGPSGTADTHLVRPWESNKAEDAKIKRKASRMAKKDPASHADVFSSRGPGFLESMFDMGPAIRK